MKMTINTALEALNITDQIVGHDQIKASYRYLANRYHPDKNPGGLEEMQKINVAYDYLSKIPKEAFPLQNHSNDERYDNVEKEEYYSIYLRKVCGLGCGLRVYKRNGKIYVAGNSYPFRDLLKDLGFRWYKDGKVWWRYN